jgi:hypothetical protein
MRTVLIAATTATLAFTALAWVALHAHYESWHPCDWLLQDTVAHVLWRSGIDPDTASIPLKASTVEAPYVQAVLRLRSTPAQCFGTWLSGRIFP